MSDEELLPLPIFPWPLSDARVALLKEAKSRISTPIRVIPVQGAYGSPGRILSFGVVPDFMCKSVPIRPENVDNVDSIEAALRFWLDEWSDERKFDEAFLLSQWMGCDVRLMHEEDETGKVVFR